MTTQRGTKARPTSAAAALILAIASIDADTLAPCSLCEQPTRLAELRPALPGVPTFLLCPECEAVARPVAADDPIG